MSLDAQETSPYRRVVGDMGMRTSVDPALKDGERVIVFLHAEKRIIHIQSPARR
jgi:hypothetical protein